MTEGVDQGTDKKDGVRDGNIHYRHQIVPEGSLVMERVHGPPKGLVEQEVLKIIFASIKINAHKPDSAQGSYYSPGFPAEIFPNRAAIPLHQKEAYD